MMTIRRAHNKIVLSPSETKTIIKAYATLNSLHKVSEKMGYSTDVIKRVLAENNITVGKSTVPSKKFFTTLETEEIIRLSTIEKISEENIAAKFGCSRKPIHKVLEENKIEKRRRGEWLEIDWTPQQIKQVLKRYEETGSSNEIAAEFNCSPPAIRRLLTSQGIELQKRGKGSKVTVPLHIQEEMISKYYLTNKGGNTIAKEFGYNKKAFFDLLEERGLSPKTPLAYGSGNPNAKITPHQVKTILTMHKKAVNIPTISKKVSLSNSVVKRILLENKQTLLTRSEANRKYTLNENYFKQNHNENTLYHLGLLAADGHLITKTLKDGSKIPNGFAIELSIKDVDVLNKLKANIGSNAPLLFTKKAAPTSGKINKYARLSIHSRQMGQELSKYGFMPNKTLTYIPSNIPKHGLKHFFRGLIDGDGSIIAPTGKYSASIKLVGSKETIKAFQKFCINICGTKSKYYIAESPVSIKESSSTLEQELAIKTPQLHVLSVTGNQMTAKILSELYENATIYMDRKYKKAMEVLSIAEEFLKARESLRTQHQIALNMLNDNCSMKDIENATNLRANQINGIKAANPETRKIRKNSLAERNKEILKQLSEDVTFEEIAKLFNLSTSHVRTIQYEAVKSLKLKKDPLHL